MRKEDRERESAEERQREREKGGLDTCCSELWHPELKTYFVELGLPCCGTNLLEPQHPGRGAEDENLALESDGTKG